jgi:hypothetical protein
MDGAQPVAHAERRNKSAASRACGDIFHARRIVESD